VSSGAKDPYRLQACSGSHQGVNPSSAGPEQPAWESLHLSGDSPRCSRQGAGDPYRLRAYLGSHQGVNPSSTRPEQPTWVSLHLSGGSPRSAVTV